MATVVDWAAGAGYRVRVRGFAHGWSPLTVTQDTGCGDRVLLLDTTRYLTVNGPVEIRVTGLDTPVDSADPPALSAIRIREDHPEWDTAVWLDLLTLPATPDLGAFYREIEQFVFTNYAGGYATARPEWSKGWAYTVDGPWTDNGVIAASGSGTASSTLDGLDPHRVFSNSFLDSLLPAGPCPNR